MKKALLVGINRYQLPGNNLRGCLNDIAIIKTILTGLFGYTDIQTLTDGQATKANIVQALKSLIASGADQMVFHYSGHGTSFYDQATNETDQALCPSDVQDVNTLISDKEMASILAAIPANAKLFFIADCCHSGTIDRELMFNKSRPRSMVIPGLEVPADITPVKRDISIAAGIHLLFSGCKDNQTSADAVFNNTPNGALTYALVKCIKDNPANSWQALHQQVLSWLASNHFEQVPQLSGPDALVNGSIFT